VVLEEVEGLLQVSDEGIERRHDEDLVFTSLEQGWRALSK
jgi:hypothetical protein